MCPHRGKLMCYFRKKKKNQYKNPKNPLTLGLFWKGITFGPRMMLPQSLCSFTRASVNYLPVTMKVDSPPMGMFPFRIEGRQSSIGIRIGYCNQLDNHIIHHHDPHPWADGGNMFDVVQKRS